METLKQIEHFSAPQARLQAENFHKSPPLLKLVRLGFGSLGYLFPERASRLATRFFSTPRLRARHKVSDPILEQAKVFEFLYGKQLLKAYEWGKGEKRALLVHGWESRGTALRSFVPSLLEKGYRVVTFDGPAHGDSPGRLTNLTHFSQAIRAIINRLGGVDAIIAHSFGGAATVFTLAHIDPEIAIERLVLVGTPNRLETIIQSAIKTMNIPPPAARRFRQKIEQITGLPLPSNNISEAKDKAKVGKLLIVHDKQDGVVPISAAKEIFTAWDNARLLITDGFGHYRLLKHPEIVEKVSRFVSTN